MKRRGPGRDRSSEDARFLYLQQISCGTEARGGEPAGYMGSSNCPSNLPDCWFSDMEQGFLQLTALSPCFLRNQQAPGGVEDMEVGAGVGDRLESGVLGGRAWEETVFT